MPITNKIRYVYCTPPARLGLKVPYRILRRIRYPTVSINRQGVKSYKYRMHPCRWTAKIQCADMEELRMFQEGGR